MIFHIHHKKNTKTVKINIWKRIAEEMRKRTGQTVEGEKEVQFCV